MPYFETERHISVTTRDLYGLEAFFNRSMDVFDVNDIGEALMRVLGVDILGRGFEMPVDIDLLLKLLMILYLLLLIQKNSKSVMNSLGNTVYLCIAIHDTSELKCRFRSMV